MASEPTATEQEICCGGKCIPRELLTETVESVESASGKSLHTKDFDPGTIIDGVSLTGKTIEQISEDIKTCRNVAIQISNHSETHTLEYPRFYTFSGKSHDPPQPTVPTTTREACSFSKTVLAACGAIGVLTYKILTDEKLCIGELAIMFSVPFDYNLYENYFALGIFDPDTPCDEKLYKQMYYEKGPFTRGKGLGNPIMYTGKNVILVGTMSPRGKSLMKVEFWNT